MIKILHITSELDGGGIEKLLFNYYSKIKHLVQFDFAINSSKIGMLESPLSDMGCKIYRIPKYRDGLKSYDKALSKILNDNHYDIVHVHSAYKAFFSLFIAKKCGVKVRIAHSHVANAPESIKDRMIRIIFTPLTMLYSTDLFACGVKAGEWVWGKKSVEHGKVYVMPNCIRVDDFKFSEETRIRIRNEFNCNEKFVIGNVARFSFQKNHEFLLNAFYGIHKRNPSSILWLIGSGELESEIKKQISDLGLNESVVLMGNRMDVADLYNAMDLFLLPSRFEGLPVTLVEVQANGLKSIVADTVTNEMAITDCLDFLPLKIEVWAKYKYITNKFSYRKQCYDIMHNSDYNIGLSAIKLANKYNELIAHSSNT